MAEQLLGKFRQLYARAEGTLERWRAAQERAAGLVASAASIVERLPAMEDDARFGPLVSTFPGLPADVRTAQAEALGDVFASLANELGVLGDLVSTFERAARDAAALSKGLNPAPRAAGAVRRGPQPSINECVVGLHDLWRIHRDELVLKRALVEEVRAMEAPAADLRAAVALFAAEPNLDPAEVRAIVGRVPAKSSTAMAMAMDGAPGSTGR